MTLPRPCVLIVFFLTIFLGAMALGPLLYFVLGFVHPVPFHRAMDRALLISAVAALGLFWSRISLAQIWPLKQDILLRVLLGYLMAVVTLQAMIGFNLALCGFTLVQLPWTKLLERIVLGIVAALLIPPLEETVFRGFIQMELMQSLGKKGGWLLAAFIFMLAHFLKVPVELDQQPVHAWSGVTALGDAFLPLMQGAFFCGRGLNLFLVGLILGGIFLRSGSLWLNAGLHSGWIFSLLLFTGLTRQQEPPNVDYFDGDILSNLSTTLVLILFGIWLWLFYRRPSTEPETGANAP